MADEVKHVVDYSAMEIPDEVVQAVENEIKQSVETRDLMGKKEAVDVLLEEYKENAKFIKKIQELSKTYSEIRRVRGDGNCFYRAYIFSCMEWLATSSDQKAKDEFISVLTCTKDKLISQGLSDFVVEDFWETLMNEVSWVQTEKPAIDDIVAHFNERNLSDYLVSYARMITSSHLKTHADQYLPFIQGTSIASFVAAEVEPMGKECDYVQCVSLATEFGVPVRIEYLDQSDTALNHHDIPEKTIPVFCLLYRPGHYDVLYARPSDATSGKS